jgi:hypothetical protein
VVAVERRGPPPYEAADRIYCLDGGLDQGLHVGDRLVVKRADDVRTLGYLWVTQSLATRAETRFEAKGSAFPMKGDLVFLAAFKWMPDTGHLNSDPIPVTPLPSVTPEPPPREGILYFLPQQTEVSPAGLKKLESWVKAWGLKGRWGVQVPSDKSVSPIVQKQRAEALQAALRAQGIERVTVELEPRSYEAKYEPAWIRHWD